VLFIQLPLGRSMASNISSYTTLQVFLFFLRGGDLEVFTISPTFYVLSFYFSGNLPILRARSPLRRRRCFFNPFCDNSLGHVPNAHIPLPPCQRLGVRVPHMTVLCPPPCVHFNKHLCQLSATRPGSSPWLPLQPAFCDFFMLSFLFVSAGDNPDLGGYCVFKSLYQWASVPQLYSLPGTLSSVRGVLFPEWNLYRPFLRCFSFLPGFIMSILPLHPT